MKYFYIQVTTQYDGLEWLEQAVTSCTTLRTAQDKANKFDFTHEDSGEIQGIARVEEIPETEFKILRKRLTEI